MGIVTKVNANGTVNLVNGDFPILEHLGPAQHQRLPPDLGVASRGQPGREVGFRSPAAQGRCAAERGGRALRVPRTLDVADVCFAVGAGSLGSFTASFSRVFGQPPTAYRRAWPPATRFVRIPRCVAMAYARLTQVLDFDPARGTDFA